MKFNNVSGWLKFNEELDNEAKKKEECTCHEDPCVCCGDGEAEKVEEKKKNPFAKMNAEKKAKKEDKKEAPKKGEKGGKKELTEKQKKLPWNKGK